jgi:hypothetical protein
MGLSLIDILTITCVLVSLCCLVYLATWIISVLCALWSAFCAFARFVDYWLSRWLHVKQLDAVTEEAIARERIVRVHVPDDAQV